MRQENLISQVCHFFIGELCSVRLFDDGLLKASHCFGGGGNTLRPWNGNKDTQVQG